jgi:arylsulfatase A-like enzyme
MRYLLILAAVALFATPFSSAAASDSHPDKPLNVLFICLDDMRPELGCYGGQAKSPNLDALAKRGVLFNRAYCQEATCSPSRTSMLTGRRPDTTRVYDLITNFRNTIPDVVTLPQYFKQHGYFTQALGKVYHGGLDDAKSWSVPHTPNRGMQYHDPKILAYVRSRGQHGWEQGGDNKGPAWEEADCKDDELGDGWVCDRAIEAMDQIKQQGKPFFLAVGFQKPHLPFVAPKKYFDLYPPANQVGLSPCPNPPINVPPIAMTNFGELRAYTDIPNVAPVFDGQARELRRAYYAATSYSDAQVGRLLVELDKLGLSNNTIVVAWGDHGWHLGDLGLWSKHTNFEVATRGTFIMSVPGLKHPGAKTNAIIEYVDIYPTLCELAGLPLAEGLEGKSFAQVLKDPSARGKEAAFSQFPRAHGMMGYTIRTDRYRYTEWVKEKNHSDVTARELYDHQADPNETRNIAAEPSSGVVVQKLHEALHRQIGGK